MCEALLESQYVSFVHTLITILIDFLKFATSATFENSFDSNAILSEKIMFAYNTDEIYIDIGVH